MKHLIDQTKQLVSITSTADNPEALQKAVDFVAAIVMKCPGVTVERFERNGKPSFLAYRGPKRPAKFDILLNAHVDVVPGEPTQFKPVVRDGKLYGRGALDMKGTALVLTDVFCQQVNVVPYDLGLQIVCDEETGGYDCVRHQIDSGVRADFVVVGEYTNERNTIYNAARGLCWAEIAFKGKAAHSGHLWHGENAVVKAEEFAAAVLKRYPTPDRETWTTTASIANLSTPNEIFNKVPDSALLKIDFRFTQEDPVFESEGSLRAFIASIDADAELVRTVVFEPAVNVEVMNPYVQGLSAAVKYITKKPAQYRGRPGGSDGRHYALVHNDIVEFGLYGNGSHSDDEYVELDSFAEYHDILTAFLRKPLVNGRKQLSHNTEPQHLQILRRLVAMPTVSSDRTTVNIAMTYLEHYFESRGFHIARYERQGFASLVATTQPNTKSPKVLLSAHIDVVPAASDKFQVTIEGDKIYGRGVADMKFAIASYMTLAEQLKESLSMYDFGIMITCDEEIGSRNGTKMLLEEEGYRPEVVVIPDGGDDWELETFCKGVQWVRLTAQGKSAHASRPWEGDSAINRLLAALDEIKLLSPADPKPHDTFASVGTIEGGKTANQIADRATAMIDIRSGDSKEHEEIFQHISTICDTHAVAVERLVNDPPSSNSPNHPLIKPFVDLITTVTRAQHKTSYSFGVTDGRFFSQANIPCVIVVPPAGGRHKEVEWLSRKGFDQFQTILETYIQQVAVTAPAAVPAVPTLSSKQNKYVWYANYGSGLSYDNFMLCINGGTPEGAAFGYAGCTDKTPPLKNYFVSLPHRLYFSDTSRVWPGGGLGTLDINQSETDSTIARIYLITHEQFEEIAAQENFEPFTKHLPYANAMKHGHAHISYSEELYDELLYCGTRSGYPIFALTGNRLDKPVMPPSTGYTQCVLKGLSEHSRASLKSVDTHPQDMPKLSSDPL